MLNRKRVGGSGDLHLAATRSGRRFRGHPSPSFQAAMGVFTCMSLLSQSTPQCKQRGAVYRVSPPYTEKEFFSSTGFTGCNQMNIQNFVLMMILASILS